MPPIHFPLYTSILCRVIKRTPVATRTPRRLHSDLIYTHVVPWRRLGVRETEVLAAAFLADIGQRRARHLRHNFDAQRGRGLHMLLVGGAAAAAGGGGGGGGRAPRGGGGRD